MSAIAGIVRKDGKSVDAATLRAMQDRMAFWGPDREGTWLTGAVGFAHALMINTPQSRFEQQPHADSEIAIVADARIDNRKQLLDELAVPENERAQLSDDRLILRAHARWGAACLDRLNGAFTFAIWNSRTAELFCARDHVGCRPLYYYEDRQRFAFATEPKALLALEAVDAELDPTAAVTRVLGVYGYLRNHSYHRALAKLPPGHCLRLRRGVLTVHRYWQPELLKTDRSSRQARHFEALRELLKNVVAAQTHSLYGVGAHLSGGLDSSSVAVLAARHLKADGRKLRGAYSWSPPPDSMTLAVDDERRRIARVCNQEDLSCTFIDLTTQHVACCSERDGCVEPTETLIHESLSCRAAAADGVRVVLSGWGGDEFASFNGRGFWAEHFWRGRWVTLLGRLAARGRRYARLRSAVREIIVAALPDAVYRMLDLDQPAALRAAYAQGRLKRSALTPEEMRLVRDAGLRGRVRASVRHKMHTLLENGHLSRRMEDWAAEGARHGIEYRYPLLDRRVVEYCCTRPASVFIDRGFPRFLLRAAMCDVLPAGMCWSDTKAEPTKISVQQAVIAAVRTRRDALLQRDASVACSDPKLRARQLAVFRGRVLSADH